MDMARPNNFYPGPGYYFNDPESFNKEKSSETKNTIIGS